MEFVGEGVDEIGILVESEHGAHRGAREGDTIVRVDPRYFRPAEVETLLGDASIAREKLGWSAKTSVEEMCREMVLSDIELAKSGALLTPVEDS